MEIILIGYGKMGKVIEGIAEERGHRITHRIDRDNLSALAALPQKPADVAIEFTQPDAAVENLIQCFGKGLPVVCGTTGWLHQQEKVYQACQKKGGSLFHASNFSVGVNIFFKINQLMAKIMAKQPAYSLSITETHHTEKKDAPSGTAITAAEKIMGSMPDRTGWVLSPEKAAPDQIPITALREEGVPGTHVVSYQSAIDTLQISHTAHSRKGFGLGAVLAAEWLPGKVGTFGMDDMLQL